jgi:outer membrane receptor protein involved in Fe transport
LSSSGNRVIDWLVGGFYTHEDGDSAALIKLLPGYFGTTNFVPTTGTYQLLSTYREFAAFGNLTVHFTKTFDIAFGGRWSNNRQSGDSTTSTITDLSLLPPAFWPPGTDANGHFPTFEHFVGRSEQSVFTYSVAPRWRITPDTMLYARVAKGYRPGGPNIQQPNAPFPAFTKADTLINYEAGIKSSLFDHKVTLELAGFYIDWDNIQLLEYSGQFSATVNGGKARSKGVEWSLDWRPVSGLSLGTSGSYNDAHLVTAAPAAGGAAGAPLPFVPKWQTSTTADYRWDLSPNTQAYVGATWNYIGERFGMLTPSVQQVRIPAYGTVDLRAGIDFKHFSIQLFAKNIADSRGINTVIHNFSAYSGAMGTDGGYSIILTRPRTIGVTLGFKL